MGGLALGPYPPRRGGLCSGDLGTSVIARLNIRFRAPTIYTEGRKTPYGRCRTVYTPLLRDRAARTILLTSVEPKVSTDRCATWPRPWLEANGGKHRSHAAG